MGSAERAPKAERERKPKEKNMEQIYYHSTAALNPAPVAYPKLTTLNNIRKVFEMFER